MSYVRSYSTVISGTVSYPKSEYGGTKAWSETVTFDVIVNDNEFNQSIGGCIASLGAVGAAMASSTNEQVKAKEQAAEMISDSMFKGFANYTKQMFSQRANELEQLCVSLMPQVMTFTKQLDEVRATMEKDYNMLKARYLKIFGKLDSDLEKKVKRLSLDSFEIAEKLLDKVIFQPKMDSIGKTICSSEDIATTQAILQLYGISKELLSSMVGIIGYIRSKRRLAEQFDSSLDNASIEQGNSWYTPVLVAQTDMAVPGTWGLQCTTPERLSKQNEAKVLDAVTDAVADSRLELKNMGKDKDVIENEFSKLLDGISDERKRAEMLRLWDSYSKKH